MSKEKKEIDVYPYELFSWLRLRSRRGISKYRIDKDYNPISTLHIETEVAIGIIFNYNFSGIINHNNHDNELEVKRLLISKSFLPHSKIKLLFKNEIIMIEEVLQSLHLYNLSKESFIKMITSGMRHDKEIFEKFGFDTDKYLKNEQRKKSI